MPLEDLIIPVSLALVLGFILGFYYVKIRITAIEEKSRAELETWKREAAGEIRNPVPLFRETGLLVSSTKSRLDNGDI